MTFGKTARWLVLVAGIVIWRQSHNPRPSECTFDLVSHDCDYDATVTCATQRPGCPFEDVLSDQEWFCLLCIHSLWWQQVATATQQWMERRQRATREALVWAETNSPLLRNPIVGTKNCPKSSKVQGHSKCTLEVCTVRPLHQLQYPRMPCVFLHLVKCIYNARTTKSGSFKKSEEVHFKGCRLWGETFQ